MGNQKISWESFLEKECQKEYPLHVVVYEDERFESWLKRQTVEHVFALLKKWEN